MLITPTLLLLAKALAFRHSLATALERAGFRVIACASALDARRACQRRPVDLVVFEEPLDDRTDGLPLAIALRDASARPVSLVLMTAGGSEPLAIAALKAGVFDYIRLPASPDEICASARRALSLPPARLPAPDQSVADMIGASAAIDSVREAIVRLAATDTNVLITGETGTGKELAAELIHSRSARAAERLVSVNCAAIPDSLLESEFFGHERGAFTGADTTRDGQFAAADRGTLFLDEIADMSPYAQAKVLRVIETRRVARLGSARATPLDVRLIAATNQELGDRVRDGAFRKDLYYRLYVAHIRMPPLRERREDIPELVAHYIEVFNRRFGRALEGLTDESMRELLRYDWPGNVRQLRNLLEATFVNLPPGPIARAELPAAVRDHFRRTSDLPQGERDELLSALLATNWNKSRAAQQLRWSRMTVYRKMAKYRLDDAAARRTERPAERSRR